MSISAIDSIYLELSKLRIGKAKARNIDRVKLKIAKSDLPMRMLLPSTRGTLSFVGMGSLNRMEWTIRDLCLWAPIVQGSSIELHAGSMVQYLRDYIAAVKKMRGPTNCSNILGVEYAIGPVPWGDVDYWAIDVTLTVEEIL